MSLDKQSIQDIYDLTPLQSGMLFIYLSDRTSSNYFIQNTFDFHGNVSIDLLRRSFQSIITRHDVLRSLFVAGASKKPVHIILKKQEADVRVIDIASADDKPSRIAEIKRKDILDQFDLEKGSLLRLTVVKVNEKSLHVIWSYHHILMDGWCGQILMEEFFKIYSALARGTEVDLLPAPSYSAYIRWLNGFNKDSSLKYWRTYLAGYSTKASLPQGFIENRQDAYRLSEVMVEFGAANTKRLAEFCRKVGITQSTFLQTVWGCLLGKYNNCQDVVFGAVVSGRPARVPGIERMVGLFINTIPVRVSWTSETSFQALCLDVHEKALQSEGHHYVQLADVQMTSELGSALIDHLMIFENFPIAEYNGGSFGDAPVDNDFKIERNGTFEHTNYNFEVVVHPGAEFKLKIAYNSNYYASEYITATRDHLLQIVDTVLSDPSVVVSGICCMSQAEIEGLAAVNNTKYRLPANETIVSLFEKMVLSIPMHAAIVCEGRSLTFKELDDASDRVARVLIGRFNVARGSIVGILLDRSPEMLIAMLAIVKSGAAYLPIDKQYPDDRISFIIEDSALRVVVSSTSCGERLRYDGIQVYCIDDRINDSDDNFSVDRFEPTESDVAYVMYTSGSTGRPKGVAIEHRNVVNFFCGMDQVALPKKGESLLALTGYTFDISVLELLWTLTRGVAVVLHTGDIHWLNRFLARNKKADFSLFYFSSYTSDSDSDKYDLLLDSVRFADENEFAAIWTPERHFHEFGGLFPNPSVVGSALAVITSRLQIRAGSIVLPLHDPIRVAEEWSVVDNLSSGRAGVSFASGWNPNDFVLAPSSFATRHSDLYEYVKTVQQLWSGEKIVRKNGEHKDVTIGIFPEPVQKNIPVWITSAGSKDTFVSAGSIGANILTHLLGQDISTLAENIRLYREARAKHGFAPGEGIVSLMVHTYVGSSENQTDLVAKGAFVEYLRSSAGLSKVIFENEGLSESSISEEVKEKIFENAYRRYAQKNSLIGTVDECSKRVMELINIGVDDFACLIDFGVQPSLVKEGLVRLNALRKMFDGQRRMPQVTKMQTTPAFLKAALDDENSVSFLRSLETIFVGGDALKDDFAVELAEKLPAVKFNMYGPTETTIWSAFSMLGNGGVTIGKPMMNTQIYLLDDNNVPVPKGVPGNIFIAGAGLARGYLNRPELTFERFTCHSNQPDVRLYKTGDVGSWDSDWNIKFHGRSDFQVKVRGHRIEPGEIEHTLKQHEGVEQVIVADKGKGNDRVLVAYVVTRAPDVIDQLRQFLSEKLPAYMIPAYFVRLDQFPLTHNGKIDRKQLPEPALQIGAHLHRLPANSTEQQLTNIWEEVLERKSIGTNDNFFELGGHSLKIVQLISRIRKDFGVQVDIREVFDHITITSQAELILRSKRALMDVIPALVEAESYQLSHAQHRFWILSQFDEGSLSYVDSVGLRLDGTLNLGAIEASINFLVKRHESLRTVFKEINGEVRQVVLPYNPNWLRVQYHDAPADNVEQFLNELYQNEQRHKFDLSTGPLLRVRVVRVANDKHILFYSVHHIISDGWSMVVIAREITNAYNAIKNDIPLDDSPLRIHYKDYAAWQRKELSGDASKEHERFWLEQLSGEIPVLDLHAGLRRNSVLTHNGSSIVTMIPARDVSALRSFCTAEGATLFMGLLSALNAFLYRISGQDDIIIGTPVAGRDHPDVENQIGLYLNTLPIRSHVCGTDTFKQFLKKVRTTVLGAYSHQVYPFDLLVEKIGVDRDMSRSALFDVLLVLQNQANTNVLDNAQKLDGIELSRVEGLERSTSRFDLEFSFMELGDELELEIIYNSDLYERSWLEQFVIHFISFVAKVSHNEQSVINEVDYIGGHESSRLLAFNNTQTSYPDRSTLVDLFHEQVTNSPQSVAILLERDTITYSQLNEESDRLALQLMDCGVKKGSVVGLLVGRSSWMMISIWGILKAGAAYMPIDPEYPVERIQFMIEDSGVRIIVTDLANVNVCDRLQWLIPSLQHYVVHEGNKKETYEDEEHASLQLWNHVAANAANDVEASGWKNSYTKEVFSDQEIEDLVSNVFEKVAPKLTSESNVLEIGCGSGLLLLRLSSLVNTYTGTDISDTVLNRVAGHIAAENITNVTLTQLSAGDLSALGDKKFDAILLNSVIQYFPSYRYLRSFLDQAIDLLTDDGFIFIGDIRDQALQADYYQSYQPAGISEQEIVRRRLLEPELFVARELLNDYCLSQPFEANAVHTAKIAKIENELTRFRFDTVIQVGKKKQPVAGRLHKWQIFGTGNKRTPLTANRIGPCITPDDLAYVIYTSGSTGKPKGTMIDHRGAVNRIDWMWKKYGFDKSDVILQKTTFCFDVSVWEIFMTHCFGARMVLCPREEVYDSVAIADRICRFGVTTIHFVPSMFRIFLDQLDEKQVASLRSLKRIFASGEALPSDLVHTHHKRLGIPLHNLYGPTEASVDVTYYETKGDEKIIPIGRPINNIQMYVLDDRLKILPVGIPGELYIAGIGLARGYLNNPTLTSERFLTNPFNNVTKLYRTGDIARWREDGNIEFLGRRDHQVKVKGFRIELDEIEAILKKHPKVADCKVIVRKDEHDANVLAAYVLLNSTVELSELRRWLGLYLPQYMVPVYFVELDKWPLTSNGKLNHKMLPDPIQSAMRGIVAQEAPRNHAEEKLAAVWRELFARENISINDNFFEVGGDSIKSVQVSARLRKFGLALKVSEILQSPVLHEAAAKIEVIESQALSSGGLFPVTPYQSKRLSRSFESCNQFVILLVDPDAVEKLSRAFSKIMSRHRILRNSFRLLDDKWMIEIKNDVDEFQITSFESREGVNPAELLKMPVVADFITGNIQDADNLALRAGLFRTNTGSRLIIAASHLVIDHPSWMKLLKELSQELISSSAALEGRRRNDTFLTWTRTQTKALANLTQKERSYWEEMIKGYSDREIVRDEKVLKMFEIGGELFHKLSLMNAAWMSRTEEVVLTAVGLASRDLFNAGRVLIDCERDDLSETNGGIGCYTSFHPLVLDLVAEDVMDCLVVVKESYRRVPGFGAAFEYIVQEWKKPLAHPMLFRFFAGDHDVDKLSGFILEYDGRTIRQHNSTHELEINARINNEKLCIEVVSSSMDLHKIEEFGLKIESRLTEIIQTGVSAPGARKITPSDLGDLEMSIDALDNLFED